MFSRFSLLAAVALSVGEVCAEPICWNDGTWDDSGAPNGVLLSDNEGWWGRCVFTGVTYSYEVEPASPKDVLGGEKALFGRRLLDGDKPKGWHRPVGMSAKRPLTVTFDFKRPCSFAEVDLISERTKSALALLEVSADGKDWTRFAEAKCTAPRTRIRPAVSGCGRYLRLRYKAETSSSTYLDEVLVWGEGEVSGKFPENIVPIARGDFLKMSERTDGNIRFMPLKDPTAGSAVKTGMPPMLFCPDPTSGGEIVMSRNETEVRYFAVVNETAKQVALPLSVKGAGNGISAELRIGGVVRTQPPKCKLTKKQLFDLQQTGDEPPDAFDAGKMDVLPFFSAHATPPLNFARKYLANPEQVSGFPKSVVIEPGEGVVVMLRVMTDGAKPGIRDITLAAGKVSIPVRVRVVDVTLPSKDYPWVFVWGSFTRQFPFESERRFVNEARPLRNLGATMVQGLPFKGTKAALVSTDRGEAAIYYRVNLGRKILDKTYRGKGKIDDEDRRIIRERVEELRRQCRECAVSPEQVVLEISDEPDVKRAKMFGDVCRYLRKVAPNMSIYMNPCFWTGKGFTPSKDIIGSLKDYYNECVDVSVPYRSLVENADCRRELWAKPRRVNAQYAHPAHRAGRSIAWSSFRYGLDGFGYWAYYSPTGNPWDIRTWKYWSYECQLAFPLENDVALTPVYEEMREAFEDWLLLSLLKSSGRSEALKSLLDEFGASFDPPNKETSRPYRCDFAALRLRALNAAALTRRCLESKGADANGKDR